MYVLPRALESAWSTARKRAWLPIVPFGETILGAGAMAMVMDAYKVSQLVMIPDSSSSGSISLDRFLGLLEGCCSNWLGLSRFWSALFRLRVRVVHYILSFH
jgi:hypothetical protein